MIFFKLLIGIIGIKFSVLVAIRALQIADLC